MPVIYKSRQATIANKEGNKMYHPQVVITGNVTLERLADEVAELSSLSPGDVLNSIKNLITVMTRHMQASETVVLDGLGSFRLSMNSTGKGFATAEEVNAMNCRLKVVFQPSTRRNSDRTVATRSFITGVQFMRIDGEQASGGAGGSGNGSGGGGEDNENIFG